MIGVLVPILTFWVNLVLLSLGLAVVYGSSRILNLAHGAFFALGGYLASYLAFKMGLAGIALAPAISLPAGILFYYYIKGLASGELEQIISTYALLLIMEGLFKYVFGIGNYTASDQATSLGAVALGDAQLPISYLLGFATAVIALGGFAYYLNKTRSGMYARAFIDDREIAEAFGVNARAVEILLVTLGVFLAILGGAVASMWQAYGLGVSAEVLPYAFAVIVIGGLDNIWGVAAAAALVSALRTAVVYLYPELELVVLYLVVLAVLALRPRGLFARHARSV